MLPYHEKRKTLDVRGVSGICGAEELEHHTVDQQNKEVVESLRCFLGGLVAADADEVNLPIPLRPGVANRSLVAASRSRRSIAWLI